MNKQALSDQLITQEAPPMNTMKKYAVRAAGIALIISLSACAGMSSRDQNTAVGAGVGAVAGSVLTGGGAVGTVGGAVVGGVIGNQTGSGR
jgi:osmotically inducible lipoprotein OsmB